MSGDSRLGECAVCHAQPAKYRCPRCSVASCSAECSREHKLQTACTGLGKAVWEQATPVRDMHWGELMRDHSYLASVSRFVESSGKELVGGNLIPKSAAAAAIAAAAAATSQANGAAGPSTNHAHTMEKKRLDDLSEAELRLCREARREGVEVTVMPKGMSRRQRNGSRFDNKRRVLEWTIELDLAAPHQQAALFTTTPQASTKTVSAVISDAIVARERKSKGKAKAATAESESATAAEAEMHVRELRDWLATESAKSSSADSAADANDMSATAPFWVLCQHHDRPAPGVAPRRLAKRILPMQTLREGLAGVRVLEYPSIEVWRSAALAKALTQGLVTLVGGETLVAEQEQRREAAAAARAYAAEHGLDRGRGRGRGGVRGSQRGGRGRGRGRGGAFSSTHEEPAAPTGDDASGRVNEEREAGPEPKRVKLEEQSAPSIAAPPPPAAAAAGTSVLGGLAAYSSDSD